MQGGTKCRVVKLTTLLVNLIQKSRKLAKGSQCHRFNLSSLSRQRRNLEGKKRGAFVATVRFTWHSKDGTVYFQKIDKQRRIDLNKIRADSFREA